ncbi:MAG: class I SAM-dependent methyltransferase [Candidatus Brocadiaceae bacterium]|jgi:methyltransferase (TIGR00027 family)
MRRKITRDDLAGVSETVLIPLHARAAETRRPDAIIRDPLSVRLVESMDYDFRPLDRAWKTRVAVAVRTEILDEAVGTFIARHPECAVVNLGAGLDTRFFRMDNGRLTWYELDLPEIIRLRREFFPEGERYRYLAASVLDEDWFGRVGAAGAVLFVAEGLLMYLQEEVVRGLLARLARRFEGSEMLLEAMGPFFIRHGKLHECIWRTGAVLSWSLRDGRELEGWDPAIRFVRQWDIFDRHPQRWRWLRFLARIPAFKEAFGDRIVHLQLNS